MQLWVVVPVKPFDEGKSRLAAVLSPDERRALTRCLLAGVVRTVQASQLATQTLVVSRGEDARRYAAGLGAMTLLETQQGLNHALQQARQTAMAAGASALLVLPSDLPLLSVTDLHELVAASEQSEVVIAPSYDGGTNALLLRPPDVLAFAFGMNSYQAHLNQATAAGLAVHTVTKQSLAQDVDQPQDLVHVARMPTPFGTCGK